MLVQGVVIGFQVFDVLSAPCNGCFLEHVAKRKSAVRVVQGAVVHAVPPVLQFPSKMFHCGKKSRYFLDVVPDVVGFVPHFGQDVHHVVLRIGSEPGVLRIQLIAQDQTQR